MIQYIHANFRLLSPIKIILSKSIMQFYLIMQRLISLLIQKITFSTFKEQAHSGPSAFSAFYSMQSGTVLWCLLLLLLLYSQLPLNGHLSKADTWSWSLPYFSHLLHRLQGGHLSKAESRSWSY